MPQTTNKRSSEAVVTGPTSPQITAPEFLCFSMELTAAQQKYFAYWLTRSLPSDSLDKLTASLQDAQVDLTPHQIDAALFAFKSPLSKGAILADEVGLGKTIEAGIILSPEEPLTGYGSKEQDEQDYIED